MKHGKEHGTWILNDMHMTTHGESLKSKKQGQDATHNSMFIQESMYNMLNTCSNRGGKKRK